MIKEINSLKYENAELKNENNSLKKENELLKKQKPKEEDKIIDKENPSKIIVDLKNKLQNCEKLIEEYKTKISQLNNQININYTTISLLQKQIKEKEEILKNVDLNKHQKLIEGEIMSINFSFISEKQINKSIGCLSTDIFATIEEKLYREFPELRETNNIFIANGQPVLRFKTVEENKIGNGYPIMLIVPEKEE